MSSATERYVWLDGSLVTWERASVHLLTHALNHGTGVFEGIRAYRGAHGTAIFRLEDHVRRLRRSANALLMPLALTDAQLAQAVCDVVAANALEEGYIRLLALRGPGSPGVNPDHAGVVVGAAAWRQAPSFSDEQHARGLNTTISSWRRHDPNTMPEAKVIGAYVNSALARAEAARAGFDEAIMLSANGRVAEATIENVFIVEDGAIATPPLSDGPLAGITRNTVMTLAADDGLTVRERSLSRADLYGADEVFLTGTGAEIVPVARVDGRSFGPPGPVSAAVTASYRETVRGERPQYAAWLTAVAAADERVGP